MPDCIVGVDISKAHLDVYLAPVCQRSPERASFWTGRRPQHVGGV